MTFFGVLMMNFASKVMSLGIGSKQFLIFMALISPFVKWFTQQA